MPQFEYMTTEQMRKCYNDARFGHQPNGEVSFANRFKGTFEEYLNVLGAQGWDISTGASGYLAKREIVQRPQQSQNNSQNQGYSY